MLQPLTVPAAFMTMEKQYKLKEEVKKYLSQDALDGDYGGVMSLKIWENTYGLNIEALDEVVEEKTKILIYDENVLTFNRLILVEEGEEMISS